MSSSQGVGFEMTRPPIAAHDPDLKGLRVLVVGLGRSGLAAARLATSRGAVVTVNDRRPEADLGDLASQVRAWGARVHAGGHPRALLDTTDLLVVSPGVPVDGELLRAAFATGLPVWGEVELAARFCRGRVIGVTGSNGKSTVTAMTGAILRAAGFGGGTGGNLATPFCDLLEQDDPEAVHVVELSSFQLETVETLRPVVSVIVNLSPDHLDRHASYSAYAAAKARLLELQTSQGHAVLNIDDAESTIFESSVRGRLHWFSTRAEVEQGAFLRGERLVLRTAVGEDTLLQAAELPVPGEHNVANALAAALVCRLAGCPAEAISEGLRVFRALPHRLERLGTVRGVTFYNDSKATNPASTLRALSSFEPRRVHLILGGRDKGADWSQLGREIDARANRVMLVGEAAEALREHLGGVAPALVDCGTIARAVQAAFEDAAAGDVVLLSPGCASFDQYRNFEERGDDFRAAFDTLEGGHA